MGRTRRERSTPKDLPEISQRIEWLLRHVWKNRIAWMADDLKTSHAALSRVLAGQSPSAKMIEALAKRANIDIVWVLTGEGSALIERGAGVANRQCFIADRLLPGPPADYPEALSAVTLPVASHFELEHPYWYRASRDDPIMRDKTSRVAAGDYMLIETSERWTRRPEAFVGRTVVLRLPDEEKAVLARVLGDTIIEYEPQYAVDTFRVLRESRLFLRTRESAKARPPEFLMGETDVVQFYQDDVVGVFLQLCHLPGAGT